MLHVFCETKVVGHVFRAAKLRFASRKRVTTFASQARTTPYQSVQRETRQVARVAWGVLFLALRRLSLLLRVVSLAGLDGGKSSVRVSRVSSPGGYMPHAAGLTSTCAPHSALLARPARSLHARLDRDDHVPHSVWEGFLLVLILLVTSSVSVDAHASGPLGRRVPGATVARVILADDEDHVLYSSHIFPMCSHHGGRFDVAREAVSKGENRRGVTRCVSPRCALHHQRRPSNAALTSEMKM